MSSFGVGELGLHLLLRDAGDHPRCGARRSAHPAFARDLFGAGAGEDAVLPMIFSFNPLRTFIEVVGPDADGFGRMTTSMLEPDRMVPLLRYQTGDIVRLLDRAAGGGGGAPAWRVDRPPIAAAGAARVAGPREGGAAERLARRLLQGRAVCRSSDCAPADRRVPRRLRRRPLHDARPADPAAACRTCRSRKACCARCRRASARRAWCSGPMRSFPSA